MTCMKALEGNNVPPATQAFNPSGVVTAEGLGTK